MPRHPLLVAAALLALTAGCARREPAAPAMPAGTPVVLISIDTLRSDRLPAYGFTGVATPAIDALARDGIVFERAYSSAPLTLPSHTSLFTGLLPRDHGVRDNIGYAVPAAELPYLPRLFREAGYATGGAVSSLVLAGNTGLRNGFDFYEDSFTWTADSLLGSVQRPGSETLAHLLKWLGTVGDRPFFAFLHLYEPHTPYAPVEPHASRYVDRYVGEIATADALVGQLVAELRRLGVYQRALVVLLSDHGEGLGDHGEAEHGVLLYRESLQVPLILKLPGVARAGSRVATPAQLLDLYPTLAPLARRQDGAGATLESDPRQAGTSLLDLDGRKVSRMLYAETFYPQLRYGWSELVSVISGSEHLINGPDPELYDLMADPAERHDLVDQQRRSFAALRRVARAYGTSIEPPLAAAPEMLERLAALGYLGSSHGTSASASRADPKTQIKTLADVTRGFAAFSEGRHAEAAALLTEAVARHPGFAEAWLYLARSHVELGRGDEALEAYGRYVELAGPSPSVVAEMAAILIGRGEPERALPLLEEQLTQRPGALRLLSQRVRALLMLDRLEEALATADRMVGAAPQHPSTHYERAVVLTLLGRAADAEREFREVLRLDPAHVGAMSDLAVLLARTGRRDEAVALLRRALELAPGHPGATRTLAAIAQDH